MADIVERFDRLHPLSACRAFHEGFAAPWDGLRFMSQHPALWRYGIAPILVNLLLTGLLLATLIAAGAYFFVSIHPKFGDGAWWLMAEIFAAAILVVVVFGLAVVVWLVLQDILCGFFYDKLARQVELRLGLPAKEIRDVAIWSQVSDGLRDVGFLIFINIGCIVVQIIPGVGSLLGLCGSYYFTCFTLGLNFLDYPLSLRGQRRSEKRLFARQHRVHTLGFGTAVAMLAIVPVVNAVFLTTAVTGAVLLHRRIVGISVA